MTDDPKAPVRQGFTACHECGNSIDLADEASFVDQIQHFFRLRCIRPDCLHVDWYKESEVEIPADQDSAADHQSQVWIHDLLLGVSFRDPGGRA